eukprot:COSAG05_NODE_107_length_18696_cov_209.227766_3_plen_389_part_00
MDFVPQEQMPPYRSAVLAGLVVAAAGAVTGLPAGCADPAASNALPPIMTSDASGDNNTACEYTCADLTSHFNAAEGDPNVVCFIDSSTDARWPPPASDGAYSAAVNSTVLIQGHADWPANGGTALSSRINVVTASVVVRHVHMAGLAAVAQESADGQASGGAIYVFDGSLLAEHVLFSNNSGAIYGGAIAIYEAQDVLIRRSYFYNNTAGGAAAVYIRPGRSFRQAIITESRGTGNGAVGDGFTVVIDTAMWGPGSRSIDSSFSNRQLLPSPIPNPQSVSDEWGYISVVGPSPQEPCTLNQLPPHLIPAGGDPRTALPKGSTLTVTCEQANSPVSGAPVGGLLLGNPLVGWCVPTRASPVLFLLPALCTRRGINRRRVLSVLPTSAAA